MKITVDEVFYWDRTSWRKIEISKLKEFIKNHFYMDFSAKSQNFWCEMCGQFVTLANGDINKPHFRHSSAYLKKDCEKRTKNFYKNGWFKSDKTPQSLPLKICFEQNDFHFEIGLIKIPPQIYNAVKVKKCNIKIYSGKQSLTYELSNYLNEDKITCLDVKNIPLESYSITLKPEISELNFYWSEKVEGVNSYGTLFDAKTGRKILYDADIKVNTKYLLLVTEGVSPLKGVTVKTLVHKNFDDKKWRLYEVEATELSEEAAKFFLNYHCRLTEKPISITPIYPVHTQDDDIIYCNSDRIFFYFSGSAKIKFFPANKIFYSAKKDNVQLIEIEIDKRHQMAAIGRTQPLQYLYIWKDLPNFEIKPPKIKVTDIKENPIASGVYHKLPKDSILQVSADFDFQIIVSQNNVIKKKIFQKGGNCSDVLVSFGTAIKIFQGLDCFFEISYERETKGNLQADEELFLKLERGGGRKIKIPHTLGSFTDKLKDYPKVKSWLYKSIRAGFVSEESYLLFRQFLLKAV